MKNDRSLGNGPGIKFTKDQSRVYINKNSMPATIRSVDGSKGAKGARQAAIGQALDKQASAQ